MGSEVDTDEVESVSSPAENPEDVRSAVSHTSGLEGMSSEDDEAETESNQLFSKWCCQVVGLKSELASHQEKLKRLRERERQIISQIVTWCQAPLRDAILLPHRTNEGYYRVLTRDCTTRSKLLTPEFLEEILVHMESMNPLEPLKVRGEAVLDLSVEHASLRQRFMETFHEQQAQLSKAKIQKRWMVVKRKPPVSIIRRKGPQFDMKKWFPGELRPLLNDLQRHPNLRQWDEQLRDLETQIRALSLQCRGCKVKLRSLTCQLDTRTQAQVESLQRQKMTGQPSGLRKSQAAKVVRQVAESNQAANLRQSAVERVRSRRDSVLPHQLPHCAIRCPLTATPLFVFIRTRQRPGSLRQKDLQHDVSEFLDELANENGEARQLLDLPVTGSSWGSALQLVRSRSKSLIGRIKRGRLERGTQYDQLIVGTAVPHKTDNMMNAEFDEDDDNDEEEEEGLGDFVMSDQDEEEGDGTIERASFQIDQAATPPENSTSERSE